MRNSSNTSDLLHVSSGHRMLAGSIRVSLLVGYSRLTGVLVCSAVIFSPHPEMLLLVAGRKQKIGFFQSRNFSTLIIKNIGYYI